MEAISQTQDSFKDRQIIELFHLKTRLKSQAIVYSNNFLIAELLAVSAYSEEMVPHGHHDICCYAILSIPIFNVPIAIIYAFETDSLEWLTNILF